jgi:hypothetical protein
LTFRRIALNPSAHTHIARPAQSSSVELKPIAAYRTLPT